VVSRGKIERLRKPSSGIRTNSAFVFHATTGIPEDTNDVDEKEMLLAEINDFAIAFEQVQETIQANTRLYEQKMDDYEEDIEQLKHEIVKQITGIMSRDNDIKELKARIAAAESQNENEKLGELDEEMRMLQNEIGNLKTEIDEKDANVNQMTSDLETTKVELEQKEIEINFFADSSSAMDEEKQSLSTRIQELEGGMNDQKKLENQLSEYKSEIDSVKKSQDSQVRGKDKEIQNMSRTIEALQSDLDKVKGDGSIWQREVDDTKATLEENEVQWKIEKLDLLAENKEVFDLSKSLSAKLDEMEKAQHEWNIERNALEEEKHDIFQEKAAIKVQLTNAQTDANQTEKRLKRKIEGLEQKDTGFNNQGDTELRKEIVSVRAKSYEESMNVQLKYEQAERQNEERIKNLECRVQEYEEERRSFRKLTGLCLNRIGSVFRRERKTDDNGIEA